MIKKNTITQKINLIFLLCFGLVNTSFGFIKSETNIALQTTKPTAVNDVASVSFASTNNIIDVLVNDDFGADGAIDGGLTMTNGTLSSASTNGGLISVDNKGTNDTSDDVFLYSAPNGFNGVDTFNYTITDASGDASTGTVTVTVAEAAPLAGPVNDTVSVDENSSNNVIDVMANDNLGVNGYGRMLIFSPQHLTASTTQGGTINLIDNGTPGDRTDDSISYTPAANFVGTDTFYYYLEVDGVEYQTIGVDAGMVTITVGNVVPVASTPTAVDDTVSVSNGVTGYVISVLSNDSFGSDGPISTQDPLTLVNGKLITASINGGSISVSDNGTANDKSDDVVLYSAPTGFSGVDSFTYSITDASGDAATATVTITVAGVVTDVPTAVNDSVNVDENSTSNVIDILANDSFGSDGASAPPMSFSAGLFTQGFYIVNKTTNQAGSATIVNDAVIHYSPAANFVGTDTFGYYIYDATGDRSLATVTVTVGTVAPPTNSTPTAVNDVASVSFASTNNIIDVLVNDDFGADGAIDGGLTMTNGTLSSASTNGGLISVDNKGTNDTSDDEFLYSAPNGFNGVDTFNYTITDASGDASTGTVTVTVGASAPLAGPVNDTVSVDENSSNNVIDVMANDNLGVNGYGRMLIFSPQHLTASTTQGGTINLIDNGTPGDRTDDSISYTPAANFVGTDTFYYYLEVDGVEYQTIGVDAGMVTITVGDVVPVADTPTAENDIVSVDYNSTDNIISILSNDSYGSDGPISTQDPLTLVNGKLITASIHGGSISVSDNGTPNDKIDDVVLYSAPSGFSGFDRFTYSITDASGDTATATVLITVVAEVTDVPTALDDTASVDVNSTNNVIDILANDSFGSDGPFSPPMSFSAGLVTQGFYITTDTSDEGGTVTIVNDEEIHYTPAANFTGTDKFTYSIYDASGDRARGEVTVTVGTVAPPTNSTPTAVNDVASVSFASTNNIIDVLVNDDFGADGAIDGGLTMTNGTLSSASTNGGLISVDNKGTNDTSDDVFLYSAPNGFNGVDTFNYTITDASGDASTGVVTLTVGASAPLAGPVNDTVSVDENSTNNVIDVMANDNLGVNGYGRMLIFSPQHLTASTTEGGTINLIDNGTPGDRTDDSISYTPAANFVGTDTFYYYLEVDGVEYQTVGVDAGMVTITVGNVVPVASTPTAVDDNISIVRAPDLVISVNVLNNDIFGSDGASLTHPLTLRNGKVDEVSVRGRRIRIDDNGTPNDKSDDIIKYYASNNTSVTSDSFTYTITDASGDASTATVYVTMTASKSSLSINVGGNKILENEFLVYPNPSVGGHLKGVVLSSVDTRATISLIDINGKLVYKTDTELKVGKNNLDLNINVRPGIMFLKITSPRINYGMSRVIFK